MIFFLSKTYIVDPHYNLSIDVVLMRGHNIVNPALRDHY